MEVGIHKKIYEWIDKKGEEADKIVRDYRNRRQNIADFNAQMSREEEKMLQKMSSAERTKYLNAKKELSLTPGFKSTKEMKSMGVKVNLLPVYEKFRNMK